MRKLSILLGSWRLSGLLRRNGTREPKWGDSYGKLLDSDTVEFNGPLEPTVRRERHIREFHCEWHA